MAPFLAFSRAVDAMNARFGRVADWMVLISCVVSAGVAALRYGFTSPSNAWLELQWYLLAGMVMLGGAYTLRRNEHVRVDLLYGWVGPRTRLWIDVFGLVCFLLPAMALLTWMTWPFFLEAWTRHEISGAPGGLVRWPVKILMPLGFALMTVQGVSELIKRIAMLRGEVPADAAVADYVRPEQ